MNQDPNPTDYPHLEAFVDWLYEHVEELPTDVEELKYRIQNKRVDELEQQLVCMSESHTRVIDSLSGKLFKVQEMVDNLLDPLERIQHGEEPVQEAPSNT